MSHCGNTQELSKSVIDSGAAAIELLITMAGVMCLWSGIMKIAEKSGFTALIAKVFSPLLRLVFPNLDPQGETFGSITMNISANLLGNTASLQLLPTMLGTLRQSYGSKAPFEIMTCVWISSACALAVALTLAIGLNKLNLGRK